MNRFTRNLTRALGITTLCCIAATTASSGVISAAEAECSRWDLNGDWKLVQTNETAPTFTLQMTPTGLQGNATYFYRHDSECIVDVCGDDFYRVDASVDGTVSGDSFEITAYWNNGTAGVYTGKISPTGRIQGSGYDKLHPQVMANWYSDRTAKCLVGSAGTGEKIGTTSSALTTAPAPAAAPAPVRPARRVKLPDGTAAVSTPASKCESAARARARNSPAAPGLEALCAAEKASGVSDGATAGDVVRRAPAAESPVVTKQDKFGAGGATRVALLAMQPENTILVRVRYKKDFGYIRDTSAFGLIGPSSCGAFTVWVGAADGSARQRHPIPINSDLKMADAGEYYVCSYLASQIPLDQTERVDVVVSGDNAVGPWTGGDAAQPPPGQHRIIVNGSREATLNAIQSRARLSYEMVYAPIVQR